jgi:hypothetical protein
MPTYKVLRTIEHESVIYLPEQFAATAPKTLSSGTHGKQLPVDVSGRIVLSEEEAARLEADRYGQIPTDNGKPFSIEDAAGAAAKAKPDADAKAKKK